MKKINKKTPQRHSWCTRFILSIIRTIFAIAGMILSIVLFYLVINWHGWSLLNNPDGTFFLIICFLCGGIGLFFISGYGLSPVVWQAVLAEYGNKEEEWEHNLKLINLLKWFLW